MTQESPGRGIRFRESMPRPLLIAFLSAGAAAVGLVVWLLIKPPVPNELDLGSRRSPPAGSLTHDVVEANLVDIPTPLPSFSPPCPGLDGVVIEGGAPAQDRLGRVMRLSLCRFDRDPTQPAEVKQAVRALSKARIRFALFTRTGDQSTLDRSTNRILLSIALSRTNVAPVVIAPLLVHEGWHLSHGGAVTAEQEFRARTAEFQACDVLLRDEQFTRGCLDARAIVALGETRAIDLLARAGFPR